MLSIFITAIGTVLFVIYALGIAGDGAVLIAAAIFIVGGMIKAELGLLVDLLSNAYIFSDYDEYYDDDEHYDDDDCSDEEDE